MQRKTGATTVIETESSAQAVLRRVEAREVIGLSSPASVALEDLSADEEKVLRMRTGAGLPRSAALERLATASDAEIELLSYEIEAYLKLKERGLAPRARRASTVAAATAMPMRSRAKEKIVRALRRKA